MSYKFRASAFGKLMSNSKKPNELSETAKTYLREMYAGDDEQIQSKYIYKGLMLEDQCIDFAAERLGYGLLTKNEESREAEHFKGTPDIVLPDAIIDVKTAWNRKTFLDAAQDANKDYEWQVRVYMALFDKPHAIVFHALLDTPEELGGYVFSNLPPEQRWVAYKYTRDFAIEAQMIERAKMADAYLNEYSKSITTKLGKICIQ